MIKNDFIQLLLQLHTAHKAASAQTGSEYINVGKFIVRISDHFTVDRSTHDLDVIFFDDTEDYIIYSTNALYKKPQHCSTAEEGIDWIKGWIKWGAPYVKGPNEIAGTNIKQKPADIIIEQETTIASTVNEDSEVIEKAHVNYKKFLKESFWMDMKEDKLLTRPKYKVMLACVKCILDTFWTEEDHVGLVNSFRNCGVKAIDSKVRWMQETFGISLRDYEQYMNLLIILKLKVYVRLESCKRIQY